MTTARDFCTYVKKEQPVLGAVCEATPGCTNQALLSSGVYRPSTNSYKRICQDCLERRLRGKPDPVAADPIPCSSRDKPLGPLDCTAGIIAYEQGELDESDSLELFQAMIDNGMVWSLQGSYGRTAAYLIRAGECVDTHGVLSHGRKS